MGYGARALYDILYGILKHIAVNIRKHAHDADRETDAAVGVKDRRGDRAFCEIEKEKRGGDILGSISGRSARAAIMFSRSAEYDLEYFYYKLNNAVPFIPDSYTNALEYLERNVMLQALGGASEIESMTLQRFDPKGGINPMTSLLSMFFMSYISDPLA